MLKIFITCFLLNSCKNDSFKIVKIKDKSFDNIIESIKDDDIESFKNQVLKLDDINLFYNNEGNLLHLIAKIGDEESLILLFNKNINPYTINSKGEYAIELSKNKIVRDMITRYIKEYDIENYIKNKDYTSALSLIKNITEIEYKESAFSGIYVDLLKKVDAVDVLEIKNIIESLISPLYIETIEGNFVITKSLIKKGLYANKVLTFQKEIRGTHKWMYYKLGIKSKIISTTALHIAAKKGYIDITRLLIENGACIDYKNSAGYSPIHSAVKNGNLELINLLLDKGSNIDESGKADNTPLTIASKKGNLKAVTLLLERGADINKPCILGTPLYVSIFLLKNNVPYFLVEKGADVNISNPLESTLVFGKYDLFELLIEKGANLYMREWSCLHTAALLNKIQITKLLLNNGADANFKGSYDNTPLHLAAKKGNLQIVNLLIRKTLLSTLNAKNTYGETALDLAMKKEIDKYGSSENRHEEVADLLLNLGAKESLKSKIANLFKR